MTKTNGYRSVGTDKKLLHVDHTGDSILHCGFSGFLINISEVNGQNCTQQKKERVLCHGVLTTMQTTFIQKTTHSDQTW